MTIRVLIADDQDMVRTGISMILQSQPGIEVVGEASNGPDAIAMAYELKPDVCLIDIRMPGLDGIAVTERLAGPMIDDPMNVVIITTFDLDEYVYGALKAGAKGFLLKDSGARLLIEAVHAAHAGESLISPAITTRLLASMADRPSADVPATPQSPLTEREEAILRGVARGRTNAELSTDLHVSVSTVKTHVTSLMQKLSARNRVELALWAYETGRLNDYGRGPLG